MSRSAPTRSSFLRVAAREAAWIRGDRVMKLLVFALPLFVFALLSATFSNAVIRDLRVDVVDEDHSQTSSIFVQAIDASPSVQVSRRSSDLAGAMHAIRSGDAIAAVYIPRNLEHDLMAGRRPQIVIFHNKQYYTPGNIASSGLQAAISTAASSLPKNGSDVRIYTPGSLAVEQYVLTNPALNYVQFLLRAILPTVLHIIVAITAGYAVGSEFGSRDARGWLEAAGGSPLTALVGKLAPYVSLFIIMMAVGMVIIHGIFHIPFRGDPVMMVASACLFIAAYLSIGALFQLLTRNLANGLTLTAIVCSPAFGFAGVGFPVIAMGTFGQAWGSLLPLRWYIQILFDQAARGVPQYVTGAPFVILAGLAIGYFGLVWLRLLAIAPKLAEPPAVAPVREAPGRISMARAFADEYGRVLRDRGAFGLIVLGPLLYGVLYPQPYLGQLIRGLPIAVVDDDSSEMSRAIIQALNADEAIRVSLRPTTLVDARLALDRREVFGVLSIPAGTEREILKGNKARLPAYVDSAYFLVYNRTLQGMTEATHAVTSQMISHDARPDGSLYRNALSRNSPIELLNQPLFNPTGGYASYIVPAAFLLILQQTLLMGSATLGGVAFQQGGRRAQSRRGTVAAVIGQSLAHLLLALPGFALYLIVLPRFYGFSYSTRILDLLVLSIPFILAVSFFGQFVGALFKKRESAVLLLIAISLPLFFLVGVAWPLEAIPRALRMVGLLFPSTFGIDAIVRVNQMGASVVDVSADWGMLWLLAFFYAVLAVFAASGPSRKEPAHAI